MSNQHLQHSNIRRTTQRDLMHHELDRHKRRLNYFKKSVESKIQIFKQTVTFLDYVWVTCQRNKSVSKKLNVIRLRHEKKILHLVNKPNHISTLSPDEVIWNFSSYVLSSTEKLLLSKGLNFAITPRKLKFMDIAVPIENIARHLFNFKNEHPDDCLKTDCRISWRGITARLKDIAVNSLMFLRLPSSNLTSDEYQSLRNLQKRQDLVITHPDKGNGVVILNKTDYISKLLSIVNDISKFKKIPFTNLFKTIISIEDNFKRKLKNINVHIYKKSCPIGSRPGRLYGLPKIHKANVPLRPILSSVGTVSYPLAKYLVPFLKEVTESNLTIVDTFTFCNEIPSLDIFKNGIMASFDIENLFTNVPLQETIEIISNYYFPNSETKFLDLNKDHFMSLLRLATEENYFLFNDELYKQLDGVAMGNPLGPIFANSFLVYHEKLWLDNCPLEFKPLFYRRYVDDTFIIFKNRDDIPLFLNYINSRHQHIKFTCDIETNNSLPFIGINIVRSDTGFSTSVFRKSTFTGLYTHIDSFVPNLYKTGLINILINRAYMLCSNYLSLHTELDNIRKILCRNGFPLGLIENCIKRFLEKKQNNTRTDETGHTKKQIFYIKFPFTGTHSLNIRRTLRKILKQAFPTLHFRFAFSTLERIGTRFHVKDRLPSDITSNIIYYYCCSSCNATYVGKTQRHFVVRRCEHLGITPRLRKRSTTTPSSAIFDHGVQEGHILKEEDFKILDRAANANELSIKEALYIYHLEPSLNLQVDMTTLRILHG